MSSTVQSIEAVKHFVKLLDSFSSDDSFKCLQHILKENTHLNERVRDLDVTNRENLLKAAQIKTELDVETKKTEECRVIIEKVTKDKQLLERRVEELRQLSAKQKEELDSTAQKITRLQKELKKHEAEVDTARKNAEEAARLGELANERGAKAELALSVANEQLKDRENELSQLTAFKVQPPDINLQDVAKQMNGLYERAYKLASTYCGDNLDQNLLFSAASWEELRLCKPITRLPMPVSNSPMARTMRIAAALTIISNILCEQVFRSDYILKASNELSDILDDLLDQDPTREQHIRAELVALCPEKQEANGLARIESAVVDIFTSCRVLVLEDKQPEFRTALESLCRHAASQWFHLQRLRQRLEYSFKPGAEDQWRMLPLLVDPSTALTAQSSTIQDAKAQNKEASRKRGVQARVNASKIQFVVWPGFLLIDKDEYDVVCEGVGLCQSQVEAAVKEERSAPAPGPHRMSRWDSRKRRSDSIAVNGGVNSPKSDKTFLPGSLEKPKGG